MNKERRKQIKQWIQSFDEDVPDEKLKEHIRLLRLKLNKVAEEYGRSSKKVLLFSQCLDKLIVRCQRNGQRLTAQSEKNTHLKRYRCVHKMY